MVLRIFRALPIKYSKSELFCETKIPICNNILHEFFLESAVETRNGYHDGVISSKARSWNTECYLWISDVHRMFEYTANIGVGRNAAANDKRFRASLLQCERSLFPQHFCNSVFKFVRKMSFFFFAHFRSFFQKVKYGRFQSRKREVARA